jgi:hypothetical protein
MQLRIAFFTALLSNLLANDFFIPVTPYGTSDHNTTAKAEASFEESDPRD